MAARRTGRTTELTFQLPEGDHGALAVALTGELDITNVQRLASAVAPMIEHDPSRLIVDLSHVAFADSSAIALWVQWAGTVPEIELHNASPLTRRVIETTGLTEMLNMTP